MPSASIVPFSELRNRHWVPIGHRIKEARERKGWTQYQLAQHADIRPATISRYEGDKVSPSLEAAIALSRALDVPIAWLADISEHTTDVALVSPPGFEAFRSGARAAGLSDAHLAALAEMGHAASRAGLTPSPEAYGVWAAGLATCTPAATRR